MRDLIQQVKDAIASDTVEPVLLAEFFFADVPLRCWSGIGTINFEGQDYLGTGLLGTIGDVQETTDTTATGVQFMLSGIPNDVIAKVFLEQYQGRPCNLRLGFFITETDAVPLKAFDGKTFVTVEGKRIVLMGDATQEVKSIYTTTLFKGTMDTINIEADGASCICTLVVENEFLQILQSRGMRYTNEEQQSIFPGDRGLEYVNQIQNKQIEWGKA